MHTPIGPPSSLFSLLKYDRGQSATGNAYEYARIKLVIYIKLACIEFVMSFNIVITVCWDMDECTVCRDMALAMYCVQGYGRTEESTKASPAAALSFSFLVPIYTYM